MDSLKFFVVVSYKTDSFSSFPDVVMNGMYPDLKSAIKRPVSAVADTSEVEDVKHVAITIEKKLKHKLLFDPGHGLEERLLKEQFE